jgi:hypothetical protein
LRSMKRRGNASAQPMVATAVARAWDTSKSLLIDVF